MYSKELLLIFTCLGLLGGLKLTSTTTTTTFVAAMSIANQDLERYFRSANATQLAAEERFAVDTYTYAFINYNYTSDDIVHDVSSDDEKGRYGEGKIMEVRGKLVHVTNAQKLDDDTACSANILGTNGKPIPARGIPWIALVRRGPCTFEEKVKNVYAKGAVGVIIYNDKYVLHLEKMQIKDKSRNITAVITYQDFGLKMAAIVDQDKEVYAAIIPGSSGTRTLTGLNRTSVLFVSISFIVLMVISLVWLIFYYIQRFRYLQTKDQQSRHLCSVTKKAIMKIPTKTGKSTDEKDADGDCCAVCIEAYKPSDCIRVLPCKHEFHKNCIDPWLIEHRTCPMCKLDVLKFYGYVFLGSEESILEYEPDRSANAATANGTATAGAVAGLPRNGTSALADLIRSRDFVIDFPRVFVLDAGDSIFPSRLPERSQSSLSLAGAKDWMSHVTNKLDEQHGLKRFRKPSDNSDMRNNLLDTRSESVRKRRSHSADGRYSNGYFERMEMARQLAARKNSTHTAETFAESNNPISRRNSVSLHQLTEATYAQSKQRQQEQTDVHDAGSTRRRSSRRESGISLTELRRMNRAGSAATENVITSERALQEYCITIQVNGEGIDLE